MGMGPTTTSASTTGCWRAVDTRAGVFDGLVHREDEASGLGGSGQSIDAHNGWFPHTRLEIISDVLIVHVYAIPHSTLTDTLFVNALIHKKKNLFNYFWMQADKHHCCAEN